MNDGGLLGFRSRVISDLRVSDAFTVNTGLRQYDSLTPILFNLVLEKVVASRQKKAHAPPYGYQHEINNAISKKTSTDNVPF